MNKTFESMGVINITPDSFSDGKLHNQLDSFERIFKSHAKSFDIVDLGAESTAPMNSAISVEAEIKRYSEVFIPYLKKNPAPKCKLSIDTYKPEVFKLLLNEIRTNWGRDFPLIFNDVSGKIDSELLELMKDESFSYVFCHNLCKSRDNASEHMNYIQEVENEAFLSNIIQYFEEGLSQLKESNTTIILDPCFGFSKTRTQNQLLLARIGEVFNRFNKQVLVGISRKSFLRDSSMSLTNATDLKSLDVAQGILLKHVRSELQTKPIFRVHDDAALKGMDIASDVLSHCHKV